ncbi:MAG: asparagine synthase-related protein, partial [Alphaproteobacteria bacterium]
GILCAFPACLVAALARRDLDLDLETLTVAFPDGADESAGAAEIARVLNLSHRIVDSREDSAGITDGPAAIADMYGVPNDNLTAFSVAQLSRMARRHMTVALSGMGGDELFYGYGRHDLLWRWRHWFRLLPPFVGLAQRVAGPLLDTVPAWRKLRQMFRGDAPWRYLAVKSHPASDILAALPGADGAVRASWRPASGAPFAALARDVDMRLVMPGSYIPAIDRGSMRASVEVRTPFLSRGLVEILAGLDQRALIADGPKHLLKRLLRRDLPDSLIDRPKQGFIYPPARYLAALGEALPASGLPDALAGEVWRRRRDYGFTTLAVRLSVLARFHAAHGPK